MPGLYSKYIKPTLVIGDAIALTVSSLAAYTLVFRNAVGYFQPAYLLLLLFSLVAWFLCSALLGTYKIYRVSRILSVTGNALKVTALYFLLMEAVPNLVNIHVFPKGYYYYHYLLLAILVIVWRVLTILLLRHLRRKGYNYRTIIVVGYNQTTIDLRRYLNMHPEYGYRFQGFFDDKHRDAPRVIGGLDDIEHFVLKNKIDEIYCYPFGLDKSQIKRLLDFVDNNLVRIKFIPEFGELLPSKLKVDFDDVQPMLIPRSIPLDYATNKVIKRTFDILFSSFVILFLLSWLLPFLAVLIKLDSRGPVFFKQERTGIGNKKFYCLKLRSMYVNNNAHSMQARRGDSRITSVGAFLRKTSLDELPQFFNVLMGQMSVVGPRPHMLKHTEEYSAIVDKFMVRHFIKPGITGLSQVRGYRGDTSEAHQMKGRVRLDIFYLENWTIFLDLKIIFYTVYNVIRGDKAAF